MKKNILVFDLETNGLLGSGKDHVIQFGYVLIKNRKLIEEGCVLFNRDLTWNPYAFKAHSIPKEHALLYGIDPTTYYGYACTNLLKKADIWIGHNINKFDLPVLKNDFNRCGVEFPQEGVIFDTLQWARNYYKKPGNGLGQLYKKFFNRPLVGAHNALVDSTATANVFDKIVHTDQNVVNQLFGGDLSLYCD